MKHPIESDNPCWFPDCRAPSSHKIGEEIRINFHNMTARLCCAHFKAIFGPMHDSYPYHLSEDFYDD